MEWPPTPDQRKGPINACAHNPQARLANAVLCFLQAESAGEANCRKPEEVNFTQAVDWLYEYAEVMGEQGNKNERVSVWQQNLHGAEEKQPRDKKQSKINRDIELKLREGQRLLQSTLKKRDGMKEGFCNGSGHKPRNDSLLRPWE